jgi:hypothetical protein
MPSFRTAAACIGLLFGASVPASALAGGSVKVTADVVGLRIFVDGADTGLTTPATLGNLGAGRHEIRVRGDCRVGAMLVDVVDGTTVPAQLASAEGRGLLTVAATPSDATIEVDGTAISGPSPVSCGSHQVRVAAPGYLQALVTVEVDVDERRNVSVDLEEVGTATLAITVTPPEAQVVLDGRVIGTGSITDDTIAAGPHIVEVQAEGYKPVSKQLLIEAGETRAFTFDLESLGGPVAAAPSSSGPAGGKSTAGGGMSPLKIAGISATAVGVGLGVFGVTRFGKAASAYNEYLDRSENGPGPESEVVAIRDDEVVPLRNVGLVTTGLGTALLAGGVTLVVAF